MTILSRTSTHRSTTTTTTTTPRFRWNDNRYLLSGYLFYIYIYIYYIITFWLFALFLLLMFDVSKASIRRLAYRYGTRKSSGASSRIGNGLHASLVTGIGSSPNDGTTNNTTRVYNNHSTGQDRIETTNQKEKEIRFKAIFSVTHIIIFYHCLLNELYHPTPFMAPPCDCGGNAKNYSNSFSLVLPVRVWRWVLLRPTSVM